MKPYRLEFQKSKLDFYNSFFSYKTHHHNARKFGVFAKQKLNRAARYTEIKLFLRYGLMSQANWAKKAKAKAKKVAI